MSSKKRKLEVISPGDKVLAVRSTQIMSILEAADTGTRLDELVAMRRRLAKALDDPNTLARDLASLSRRQLEISREIEDLERRQQEEAEEDAVTPDEEWEAI